MRGRVVRTLVRGETVYADGAVDAIPDLAARDDIAGIAPAILNFAALQNILGNDDVTIQLALQHLRV